MTKIYLDNASTTQLDARVLDKMMPFLQERYGNASSIHAFGQQTRDALEDAREGVAKLLNAKPSEIFFTSGGTESDNAAIKGVALAHLSNKKKIVSSPLEHKAVLESLAWLEKKFVVPISFLQHDCMGKLDIAAAEKILTPDVLLLSVMHANNELGTINPIAELAAHCHSKKILIHTDAVQTAGKLNLDVETLGVDLLSLSAHKFHGPKGVGVLYVRTGVQIENLFHGGSHERGRRAGTENVANAVGLYEALRLATLERHETHQFVSKLKSKFLSGLETIVGYTLNGGTAETLPYIANATFTVSKTKRIDGDMLVLGLDAEGVAASSGSACTSGTATPSHVLLALGLSEADARSSVRFSFSKFTTESDIDVALEALTHVLARLR